MTDEQRADTIRQLCSGILEVAEAALGGVPTGEVLAMLTPAAILAIGLIAAAAGGTQAGVASAIQHFLPMVDEAFAAAEAG